MRATCWSQATHLAHRTRRFLQRYVLGCHVVVRAVSAPAQQLPLGPNSTPPSTPLRPDERSCLSQPQRPRALRLLLQSLAPSEIGRAKCHTPDVTTDPLQPSSALKLSTHLLTGGPPPKGERWRVVRLSPPPPPQKMLCPKKSATNFGPFCKFRLHARVGGSAI